MLEKKKTRCVGRILVDGPEQAATGISVEMIQGFAIDTFAESEEKFRKRLKSRESEVAVQPTDAKDPGRLVATSDLHTPGMIGRVLVYGRGLAYGIENGSRVESEWVSSEGGVERVRGLNFTTGLSFMWEFRGGANDPLQPFPTLNMETGTNPRPGASPVESSLHEDAAVASWDAISSSIRLRKAGVSSTSSEINPAAHFISPCLHFSNAKCVPDEILFDIPRLDDRTVSRKSFLSSVPGSIATSVSTLP